MKNQTKKASATESAWQQTNRHAINERLAWLRDAPDGTLADVRSPLHHITITKQGDHVAVYFVDPRSGALEGPMSRIDVARPLFLAAEYMQVALLALAWRPRPQHVCVLGFAGGRLPLVLHHHLPDAVIDSVDIDPAFRDIAERYFGVAFDARQRLHIADGRSFLGEATQRYDIIVMDAFSDERDNLDHLATTEFYAVCQQRLAPGGAVCINLLKSDEHFFAKLHAVRATWPTVYLADLKRAVVVLASSMPLGQAALVRQIDALQRRHDFDAPLAEHAEALQAYRDAPVTAFPEGAHAPALSDADAAHKA